MEAASASAEAWRRTGSSRWWTRRFATGPVSNHGPFDGYKAHVAVDPETELVTEVALTPANAADAEAACALLPELGAPKKREGETLTVVGDSAYGSGPTRALLREAGAEVVAKAPPETNSHGGFPKSTFLIDPEAGGATCPAGITTTRTVRRRTGELTFRFPAKACSCCSLRNRCTDSRKGRAVTIGPHEGLLAAARADQKTPASKAV